MIYHHRDGGNSDHLVCSSPSSVTHRNAAQSLHPGVVPLNKESLGWLHGIMAQPSHFDIVFVGFGHSVLAMSGEETLAQVNREIEHPKLKNLEKTGLVIFVYSLLFTSLVSFFAVMIIPDKVGPEYFGNLIGGIAMYPRWPHRPAAGIPWLRGVGGRAHFGGRAKHIDRRRQRRAEPHGRGRRADLCVSEAASPLRHQLPRRQPDRCPATAYHFLTRGNVYRTGGTLRLRRDLEFCLHVAGGGRAALQGSREPGVAGPRQSQRLSGKKSRWA